MILSEAKKIVRNAIILQLSGVAKKKAGYILHDRYKVKVMDGRSIIKLTNVSRYICEVFDDFIITRTLFYPFRKSGYMAVAVNIIDDSDNNRKFILSKNIWEEYLAPFKPIKLSKKPWLELKRKD